MDKRVKECLVEWARARKRFLGCMQSSEFKMDLRYAERELMRLANEMINEDEASESAATKQEEDISSILNTDEARWIDCLKMMPERVMRYEAVPNVIPTEYATQPVYVMDEDKTEVSVDYRLITINGDVWKSRRRWRWWMPKSMLRKVPV